MKISDLEKELGLTRHTIRYYEKEGFIHPKRDTNDYRDYSNEDVQILKLVKFLRNLNISVDDIKGIIDGKLNFHDCLRVNQIHLDNQIEQMKDIKNTIDQYEEKGLPLIPALNELKTEKKNWKLGMHKTTKHVSLGRRLTKAWAKRQILYALFAAIFASVAFTYFMSKTFDIGLLGQIMMAIIIVVVIVIIFIASAFRQTSSWMLDNSMDQSIEFYDDGIEYYKFEGFIRNFKYFIAVLLGKEKRYMKKYRYEDIKEVEIVAKRRYTNIMMPIATDVVVVDFRFQFNDGVEFYFLWPMILDDDAKYISVILQNKVNNIKDRYHILYAMEHGINLTDYLIGEDLPK